MSSRKHSIRKDSNDGQRGQGGRQTEDRDTLNDDDESSKKEAMKWAVEHLGYTDQDNPYGDPKLSQKFVWHKKMEKEKLDEPDYFHAIEARHELQKLKSRRIERERSRDEREREREFMQRQKETEYYKEWAQHEDKFHLKQVTLRSRIRIQDNRAKPIDLLARYIFVYDRFLYRSNFGDLDRPLESKSAPSALSTSQNDFFGDDFEDDCIGTMDNPALYLDDLSMRDLEDLLADIDVYGELDRTGSHADYWHDVLAKDLLANILDTDDPNARSYPQIELTDTIRRSGINKAVADDILKDQLHEMEASVRAKVESNESNVDIGYWESLHGIVEVFKAKARLQDIHDNLSKLKCLRLRSEHKGYCVESDNLLVELSDDMAMDMYHKGQYEPMYHEHVDIGLYVLDEREDMEKLRLNRSQVLGSGFVSLDAEDAFERRVKEGITGRAVSDEASHAEESSTVLVEQLPVEFRYLWSDKYRPRKPRFFNKVHTGYDWNQYNKKHYDTDNPPPKTVQGYKFNIFYPDLIDKSETPVYEIKHCEDCRDFSVLRFHAGPPYEDIAFKVVNKEWDFSHKHGFRCQFQNGIFQLWFHFRKWKYRR
ncbi:hypothetical protein ACOME3_002042 [Neoechinorhynchus agilis]